jgi:hypothetical protein
MWYNNGCLNPFLTGRFSIVDFIPAVYSELPNMPICSLAIHGHFYQPPREDPITGKIPIEPGAGPFRNWNERIHAECYKPNAELGNFERISFNIGPTLFAWMNTFDPDTYKLIIGQDRQNVSRYGIGNAIAQSFNHTILPLATYQDKVTQVAWGIADFKTRFGRNPAGMWLPETAVDYETLSVLADQGIEFTILAPWQAEKDTLDTTEPYRVVLPEGKSIAVFFYNRELSTRISFDPASTSNADVFAHNEVVPNFRQEKIQRGEPQLLLIASDGELYGHHQHFRDRFLAHLVNGASADLDLIPTYPALWLKTFPAQRRVTIKEKTSWSCHHGVMRWMGECSCTVGDGVWKAYLRLAFDRLAAAITQVYQDTVSKTIADPWGLRNRYIYVVLGEQQLDDLINEFAGRKLPLEVSSPIKTLLAAEYEKQRMFTSCGWYFEDFSRIEPKNNVAYAAQAVRLVRKATGIDLAPQALIDLRNVFSHRSGLRGDIVFHKQLLRAEKGK